MKLERPLRARRTALWLAAAALVTPALAEPGRYTIDPTHTFVSLEVMHFNTSLNRARWVRKEGRIEFDRAGRSGRAEITIDMASVSSGVPSFDRWMVGKELFDVGRFPTARFVGERFVFAGDKVSEVRGALTLMGQTHPLTLKATLFNCYTSPLFRREVCGGDFEATLQRSRWGLTHGLPAIAPDDVRVLVQVEAIRQP
ncbi:MAG: polyisoprenoid-binding protein [Burkholderiales bacterium]|nr:polyisoprenoid-binding protein [Burkholderiales bacterium]